jgi:hypothetical protein
MKQICAKCGKSAIFLAGVDRWNNAVNSKPVYFSSCCNEPLSSTINVIKSCDTQDIYIKLEMVKGKIMNRFSAYQ